MATYTITVTKTPVPEAGIVKVGSSTASGITQEEGTDVNILASPASGYFFVSWEIDSVVVSTSSSYTFVMPSNDITLKANFEATPTPSTDEQPEIYDTDCPRFFFVSNLNDRFFTGDVVNLNAYTYQEVNEPISFDTGMFKLERDLNYHGFNYEFGVDELQYELGSEGFTYLRTQLLTGGTDSDIKFVYGFGQPDALTIFYIGKVDFNEYKEVDNGEKVSFSLVELDFDNLLQTAFEVDQVVAPVDEVLLHSKVLPKKIEYLVPKPDFTDDSPTDILPKMTYHENYVSMSNNGVPTDPTHYIYINDGREGDDIDIFTTYDFQMDVNNPFDDVYENFKYLFRAKQAGKYTINVKAQFKMVLQVPNGFATDDPTYSFMKLVITRTESDGQTVIGSADIQNRTAVLNVPPTDGFVQLQYEYTKVIDVNLEDCIYLFFQIDPSDLPNYFVSGGSQITDVFLEPFDGDALQPQISVVASTLEKASKGKVVQPYTLINNVLKSSIEEDRDVAESTFFQSGCGSKLYITNGFNIRGLDISPRTDIKVSAKTLMDSLSTLFNVGFGVEYNVVKQEVIRVEPVEYFYQDVNILNLDNISDYQKEIDSSAIYNEVEIGFRNYSKSRETDKGFTLDDIHTKHVYQTPIKTNKNKLSVISDLTLSGYEIEILRRKQFDKKGINTDGNFREDENLFGVQVLNTTKYSGDTYSGFLTDLTEGDIINLGTRTIIVVGYAYHYTGQQVLVNVDSQGDKETSIQNIQYGYFTPIGFPFSVQGTQIKFTSPIDSATNPIAPSVVITNKDLEEYLVVETNQPFESTSNLVSPETSYNLRYTPKRMLYNRANLLNGNYFTKLGTQQVTFKQGDGNVDFSSRFLEGESCLLGDVNRSVITEGGNVNISELGGRNYLFLPIKVSFSTSLSFEQLTDLKKCLRGQDGTRDYGYVTITSPCGDAEKIFITSVEYSGVTEEAKIEGYLKEITGIE